AAQHPVRGRVNESMDIAQQDEQPGKQNEQDVGLSRNQREDRDDIEQYRYFELVAKAVRNLRRLCGPVLLSKGNIAGLDRAVHERAAALLEQPNMENENEQYLNEERRKHELDRHVHPSPVDPASITDRRRRRKPASAILHRDKTSMERRCGDPWAADSAA